jgi:hypothetical protein
LFFCDGFRHCDAKILFIPCCDKLIYFQFKTRLSFNSEMYQLSIF